MSPTLDDLLGDIRLKRLFSGQNCACAFQLWVLQIQSEQSIEIRVVYGRLLPYCHSSNSWSFSDNDKYLSFGSNKVKIVRLNLYIDSTHCADLLRHITAGQSISAINDMLGLKCTKKFKKQFGSTALMADNLVYRPVAYLFNRDAYESRSLSSPHSAAGAFSASITQTNKKEIFLLNGEYSTDLIASLVKQLKADTGLDFGGVDATRFGDLELLVFPTLNDREQNLLSVRWTSPCVLTVRFDSIQVPFFEKFQFHLSISNGRQIISSTIAWANRDEKGVFEYEFHVSEDLRKIIDSTELEIFGFSNTEPYEGVLCCRSRVIYLREINFQGSMQGTRSGSVKFDWLEKTIKPAQINRGKAALTINRGNLEFRDRIGGREADPWVTVNDVK